MSQAALEAIWKTVTDPSFFIEMRDEARTRRPVFLMASDASDIGYGFEIFRLTPSQAPAPERWVSLMNPRRKRQRTEDVRQTMVDTFHMERKEETDAVCGIKGDRKSTTG